MQEFYFFYKTYKSFFIDNTHLIIYSTLLFCVTPILAGRKSVIWAV